MSPRAALDDARMSRLKSLFSDALTFSGSERALFIQESTREDETLRDELSSLLEAHERSDSWFERLAEELIAPALVALDSESEADAEPANRTVSHYEILERTGGGGMGVVYKAQDTRLGRLVALKFLPRHHASNPSARARLIAEARAASRLDHANIGTVYEIGEADDGRQFIAMAWYEGETLKEKIRRDRLSVQESVSIALQLGSALSAAHRAGIIHRDVKPANVMMTTAGTAKLVDFGIAKLATEADHDKHVIAGTLGYMSPEQTKEIALDPRTDIWSLGVVLYEMLAGHRPFRASDDSALVQAIRKEDAQPVSQIRNDVSPRLSAVIDRCLAKDRDARFAGADEFCDALRDSVSIDIVESAPHARRRRRLIQAAAAVAAISVISLAVVAYSRANERSRISAALLTPFKIGVVPLSGAGADSSQHLADAMTDDLGNELSRFPVVVVADYFASEEYLRSRMSGSEIARALGSRYLITGKASFTHDTTRLSLALFDALENREIDEREYTARQDDPDIVRHATRDLLSRLDIPLTSSQKQSLRVPRFRSNRAYDLYLRGRYEELSGASRKAMGPPNPANLRRAQALYAQARPIDPGFARLRSRLGATHMLAARSYDTTGTRLEQARIETEAALRLDPQLMEARATLAEYWVTTGNPDKALQELEAAAKEAPNSIPILLELATRYRILGRWEEAVAILERCVELDPRNPDALWRTATSLGRMRRNIESMQLHARHVAVWPRDYEVRLIRGQAFLRWRGSPDTLFAELSRIPRDWDDRGMAAYARYTAYRVAHRFREGLAALDSSSTSLSRDGLVYQPKSLMRAELYHDLGNDAEARRYYDLARREMLDSIRTRPKDGSIRASLAVAYAGLGLKREAIAESERAIAIASAEKSLPSTTAYMGSAVEVFARVGELDRAFETIELMLTMNSGREITVAMLEVWPSFAPLRKDPRYSEMLKRFSVR